MSGLCPLLRYQVRHTFVRESTSFYAVLALDYTIHIVNNSLDEGFPLGFGQAEGRRWGKGRQSGDEGRGDVIASWIPFTMLARASQTWDRVEEVESDVYAETSWDIRKGLGQPCSRRARRYVVGN